MASKVRRASDRSAFTSPAATFSSREFNRDVSAAKRAAANGPVLITDRGAPAFVLLSIEDYRRNFEPDLTGSDLLNRLSMDEDVDFEIDPIDNFALHIPQL